MIYQVTGREGVFEKHQTETSDNPKHRSHAVKPEGAAVGSHLLSGEEIGPGRGYGEDLPPSLSLLLSVCHDGLQPPLCTCIPGSFHLRLPSSSPACGHPTCFSKTQGKCPPLRQPMAP